MKILLILILIYSITTIKINDKILRETSLNGGKTDIIVVMKNQIDLEKINLEKLDKIQIGRKIFDTLYQTSKKSQKSIHNFLNQKNLKFKFLWIQKYFHSTHTKLLINSKYPH
jgi:hypothetical protein